MVTDILNAAYRRLGFDPGRPAPIDLFVRPIVDPTTTDFPVREAVSATITYGTPASTAMGLSEWLRQNQTTVFYAALGLFAVSLLTRGGGGGGGRRR